MFTERDRNRNGTNGRWQPLKQFLKLENYSTLARWFVVHRQPVRALFREFVNDGAYPAEYAIRTPIGKVDLRVFHPEDLSTLNLVFCREDYVAPQTGKVFVDIGSNIGLATAYFLTRNTEAFVYSYEPVSRNIQHLKENLEKFEGRYELSEVAVSDFRGSANFGVEASGKLGSLDRTGDDDISVQVVHVMDVLEPILARHGTIDCLKIDVEGHESRVLRAIDQSVWPKIGIVNVDSLNTGFAVPDRFSSNTRGSASRYFNQTLATKA